MVTSCSAPIHIPKGIPGSDPSSPGGGISDYMAWLSSSISRYEGLAKSLVRHRSEKGRIIEGVVKSALRVILPGRFSIGTGFAITASGKISSQLDLVIYDGLGNAPIILEGGTGLFPVECIYGFVEVKSVLNGAAIDDAAKAIGTIRDFAKEKQYVAYGCHDDGAGKSVVGEYTFSNQLSPRSFVFSINSKYRDIDAAEARFKKSVAKYGAHLHGLAVMERDWFISQTPHRDPPEFVHCNGQSFATFCAMVLNSIQSIEMHPAAMGRYLASSP